jgi:hypothetical protein
VSDSGPDRPADRPPPVPPGGAVRVFNRSDRVWVFGFVRMAPLVLFVGGMVALCLLSTQLRDLPTGVVLPLTIIVIFGPFGLDRLPQLNPVSFLVLSARLRVTRIAGRPREFGPDRVASVELAPREGEDYDDRDRGKRLVDAVVRFHGGWPARLQVTEEAAAALADWARGNGVPIHEPQPPADSTGHEPG